MRFSLISLMPSLLFLCYCYAEACGKGTRISVASMIGLPRAWRPWSQRYDANILNSSSITPALRGLSLGRGNTLGGGQRESNIICIAWGGVSYTCRYCVRHCFRLSPKSRITQPILFCVELAYDIRKKTCQAKRMICYF